MYPKKKPRQVCKYVQPDVVTIPGTDTTLMPLIDAPIIPKATKYQGERWLPLKKASLDASLRDVRYPTPSKRAIYVSSMVRYIIDYRVQITEYRLQITDYR